MKDRRYIVVRGSTYEKLKQAAKDAGVSIRLFTEALLAEVGEVKCTWGGNCSAPAIVRTRWSWPDLEHSAKTELRCVNCLRMERECVDCCIALGKLVNPLTVEPLDPADAIAVEVFCHGIAAAFKEPA